MCTLPPDIGNFPIMIDLPNEAGPAAEFLVRHLYRQIDVEPDSCYHAIAETADSEDDKWFWNDDNAKVLEFMSRPELWRRYPTESSEILRFVGSMCRGPFIFRRMSAPRLQAIASTGPKLRYRHSLMRISFDQRDGSVVAGIRFHDERDGENLSLCGNYVEFTYRGCRFKIPVPANGGASHAEQRGQTLRLRFSCKLHFTSFWQRRQLGDVIYTCTFDSRSMLFEVEAALDLNPAITVSDVVLTIGHGGLEYCLFSRVVTASSSGSAPLYAAGKPSTRLFNNPGDGYYVIRQEHVSADSLAVHSLPNSPGGPWEIETEVRTQGQLDRVIARYRFAGAHRGGRLVASEVKMITAGGLYDQVGDYAALLREAAAPAMRRSACDFSISYDYGATINALAKCFALSGAASAPTDLVARQSELRGLFDFTLGQYIRFYLDEYGSRPDAIFSRELAFAALGAATMHRATGCPGYRRQLELLIDVLLEFEMRFESRGGTAASGFLMRKDNPNPVYLDCQSAALLALTQAAGIMQDPRLPEIIERGIAAYRLAPQAIDLGAGGRIDTVGMVSPDAAGEIGETAFWNFKAGLTPEVFRRPAEIAERSRSSHCITSSRPACGLRQPCSGVSWRRRP